MIVKSDTIVEPTRQRFKDLFEFQRVEKKYYTHGQW